MESRAQELGFRGSLQQNHEDSSTTGSCIVIIVSAYHARARGKLNKLLEDSRTLRKPDVCRTMMTGMKP